MKHAAGKLNRVADALSRRAQLLTVLQIEVIGFKHLKDLYAKDVYFAKIGEKCNKKQANIRF